MDVWYQDMRLWSYRAALITDSTKVLCVNFKEFTLVLTVCLKYVKQMQLQTNYTASALNTAQTAKSLLAVAQEEGQ